MKEEKRVCQYCGAKCNIDNGKETPITGIIRTKDVCNNCYKLFKEDNQLRHDKGISIPNSFKRLR